MAPEAQVISLREENAQYATFRVAGRMYGIDVRKVHEVVKPMDLTRVPLAAPHVRGLINLRGQVATAFGLREFLGLPDDPPAELYNVVCRFDGQLLALLVDEIGDVLEVSQHEFEPTPNTVPPDIRKFMSGVYKVKGSLISVLDIEKIFAALSR